MMKLAVPCGLALAFISSACNPAPNRTIENNESTEVTQPAGTAGSNGTVRVADLMATPDKYVGRTVTVVADVEEVLGPNAFTLDEDAPLAGGIDNDMLVLSKQANSLSDIDDQWVNNKVRVTGMVRKMSLVDIEREIGWDLNSELEAEFDRRGAVLIATSVSRVNP
jgi:hypothetical protein